MKVVKQGARSIYERNPLKHIEQIGRICYKSEDKISDNSTGKFVDMLYNNRHKAMLEHFRFMIEVSKEIYDSIMSANPKYINGTDDSRYVISASSRGLENQLSELRHILIYDKSKISYDQYDTLCGQIRSLITVIQHIVYVYDCAQLFGYKAMPMNHNMSVLLSELDLSDKEVKVHGWHSVLFTCDRGVSHEMVRHRPASFAQESTRYCNYSNDKFGREITVIQPPDLSSDMDTTWFNQCVSAEESYFELLDSGATPQIARSVLPNSLKTDIVVTATNKEWDHIFDLRYYGLSGKPHPQMVELMQSAIDNIPWCNKYQSKYGGR